MVLVLQRDVAVVYGVVDGFSGQLLRVYVVRRPAAGFGSFHLREDHEIAAAAVIVGQGVDRLRFGLLHGLLHGCLGIVR